MVHVAGADQAEPTVSFDPPFEGRQHPLCPNRRFDPGPSARGLSVTFSPCGHCLRLVFRRLGHRGSTSLHPFAPPALPGFFATASIIVSATVQPFRRTIGLSRKAL